MTNLVSRRFATKTFFVTLVMAFVGGIVLCNGDVSADGGYIQGTAGISVDCTEGLEKWNCWANVEPYDLVKIVGTVDFGATNGDRFCVNWYKTEQEAKSRKDSSIGLDSGCVSGDFNLGYFYWNQDGKDPIQTDPDGTRYSTLRGKKSYAEKNKFSVRYDSVTPTVEGGQKVYKMNVKLYVVSYWTGEVGQINELSYVGFTHREDLPEVELTADAYEDDAYLYPNGFNDSPHRYPLIQSNVATSGTVIYGNNATISMNKKDFSGYSWEEWGTGGPCKGQSRNNCTVKLTGNKTVNAYYVRNRFNGFAKIMDGEREVDTGMVGAMVDGTSVPKPGSASKTIKKSGCPNNGCEVQVDFGIQRVAGNGGTAYTLWKKENGGAEVQDGGGNWTGGEIPSITGYVRPGNTVCWKMKFESVAAVSGKEAVTSSAEVCAEAETQTQPSATLSADAREDGTKRLLMSGLKSTTVPVNSSAKVSVNGVVLKGYSWCRWGTMDSTGTCDDQSKEYQVERLTSDRTINAYYVRNKYKGYARVRGEDGRSSETNWVEGSGSDEATITMSNCPSEGCAVEYDYEIQRTAGLSNNVKVGYYSEKTVNGVTEYNDEMPFVPEYIGASGYTFTEKGPDLKVKPGEKLCVGMVFETVAEVDLPKSLSASERSMKRGDVKVCAEADAAPVTLTVDAVRRGNEGNPIEKGVRSAAVEPGDTVTVSMVGKNYTGYTWDGWEIGKCDAQLGERYCTVKLDGDERIKAYYVRNKYEGRARVDGGGKHSETVWATGTENVEASTIKLDNCTSAGGEDCKASFDFDVRRLAGEGNNVWIEYYGERTVNGETEYFEPVVESRYIGSGISSLPYPEEDYLSPGEKVCWTMKFETVAEVDLPISLSASERSMKRGDVKVCAEAEMPKVTLKINAKEKGSSRTLEENATSASGVSGSNVTATLNKNYGGYTWYGWDEWECDSESGRSCTVRLSRNMTINAYFVRNKFEGNATVSYGGQNTASTGWVGANSKTERIMLSGCPSIGCEVRYGFGLQRKEGTGNTNYTLWKKVNSNAETQDGGGTWIGGTIQGKTEYVKPGDTVCWTMKYDAVAAVNSPNVTEGAEGGEVRVCAEAEAAPVDTGFQGKIDVSGGVNHTSEYTKNSRTDTYDFRCNNVANGCAVTFNHFLDGTTGSTVYIVQSSDNKKSNSDSIRKEGRYYAGDSNEVLSDTVRVRPGMKVCESLAFYTTENNDVGITTCVVVTGDVSSTMEMLSKNDNASGDYGYYTDLRDEVYAKPGDTVDLRGEYTPHCQYAQDLNGIDVAVRGTDYYQVGSSRTIRSVFDGWYDDEGKWKNAFSVSIYSKNEEGILEKDVSRTLSMTPSDPGYFQNTVGSTDKYTGDKSYKIQADDVGATLRARAETNEVVKTSPNSIKFSFDTWQQKAEVDVSSRHDDDYIRVPYNYENSTKITNTTSEAYAIGEKVPIIFKYSIKPRKNSKTTNDSSVRYATSVDVAKWKLVYCIKGDSSNCDELEDYDKEELLPDSPSEGTRLGVSVENMSKTTTFDKSGKFEVPDVPVGTVVCVKSAIYPASSGSEDNYDNPNGDGKWAFSTNSRCFTVAKNPSFQVWGGNVYSAAGIETAPMTRNGMMYGSWVEYGLANEFATGAINMASGAGLNKIPVDKADGGCGYSTLTFMNDKCKTDDTNHIHELSGIRPQEIKSVDDLKGLFGTECQKQIGDIWDDRENGTCIYNNEADVTITSEIEVGRDVEYGKLSEIPRVIVYASGDINIECHVGRIDAILVAGGTINTCSDNKGSADYMKKLRGTAKGANLLTINGMLSADRIEFNRTIGASKDKPGEPAEIINFDTTLLMLGMPSSASSGLSEWSNYKLEAVRDAAPRV